MRSHECQVFVQRLVQFKIKSRQRSALLALFVGNTLVNGDSTHKGPVMQKSLPFYDVIMFFKASLLTHWGQVTHICVSKLAMIGPDSGLSPGRHQAIISTKAGILLIEPLGTNFSDILIGIQIFSFKKMRLKMSSAKWRPFCLGLNVLITLNEPGIGSQSQEYACRKGWIINHKCLWWC